MQSILDIEEAIKYRKNLVDKLELDRGKISPREFENRLVLISVIDGEINRLLKEQKLPGIMGAIYHWIFG